MFGLNRKDQKAVFPSRELKKVSVSCNVFHINIVKNDQEQIVLRWKDTNLRELCISICGSELNITDNVKPAVYELLALTELMRERELFLEIPGKYEGDVCVKSINEAIHFKDISLEKIMSWINK